MLQPQLSIWWPKNWPYYYIRPLGEEKQSQLIQHNHSSSVSDVSKNHQDLQSAAVDTICLIFHAGACAIPLPRLFLSDRVVTILCFVTILCIQDFIALQKLLLLLLQKPQCQIVDIWTYWHILSSTCHAHWAEITKKNHHPEKISP